MTKRVKENLHISGNVRIFALSFLKIEDMRVSQKNIAGHDITMSKAWAGYRKVWGAEHPTWEIVLSIDGNRPMGVMFHDSISNGKKMEWSDDDWLNCLHCILLDAFAYEYNPYTADFLREFGYCGDNMADGKRAYELCRSTYEKLSKMVDMDELINICNAIED